MGIRWWKVALVLVPVASVVLLSTGCANYRQSPKTRADSFIPYNGRHIGNDEIKLFLVSRVAFLISSDHFPTNDLLAGKLTVSGVNGLGCAAAIDPRGYFLTASHCLSYEETYLFFYEFSPANVFVRQARVVWRGNRHKGEPDLAILHVNQTLNHTFDWAPEIHRDDPAMAVGMAWSTNLDGFAFLGGKILDFEDLKAKEGGLSVASDIPLQSGDSGGPLLDAKGRLIGINVQGTPPFVRSFLPKMLLPMIAESPNRDWLRELIEKDAAQHPIAATAQVHE